MRYMLVKGFVGDDQDWKEQTDLLNSYPLTRNASRSQTVEYIHLICTDH